MTTLIKGSTIVTMAAEARPANGIAVDGPRIVAVGDFDDLARRFPDADQKVFEGSTIIPGLIESHVHPAYTGFTDNWANCRPEAVSSIGEIQQALRNLPHVPGQWLVGWGYDDTLLAERRHPNRDDLDAVSMTVPILIRHISGHFAVGNTAALEASGLSEDTVSSDDPDFPRGPDDRLTGLAWEIDAVHRLGQAMPAVTSEQIQTAITHALRQARRRGITCVHDMGVGLFGGPGEVAEYRALADRTALATRVRGYLRGDLALRSIAADEVSFAAASGDAWFKTVGAKFWADGSIQGLSAALRIPYACDSERTGELLIDPVELAGAAAQVAGAGGQVAVHANGDAAVAVAVQALSAAPKVSLRPHRIEHCQVTEPRDLEAIASNELAVSFFVNHVYYWGDRHRDLFLGPERANRIDPLNEADERGILFGLHSDCPITPMDPLRTIGNAVRRLTSSGVTLGADQRVALERALRAMTIDSARMVGDEADLGSLEPGKYADLVVLPGTLAEAVEEDAGDPLATMIGGSWD